MTCTWDIRLLRQHNGDNHSVQSEGFSEDEDEDHSYEDCILLGVSSHSCISDDTDSESSSLKYMISWFNRKGQGAGRALTNEETPQQSPDAKCLYPEQKVQVSGFIYIRNVSHQQVMNLQAYLLEHEQRDDQSINTQDTSHDNWND